MGRVERRAPLGRQRALGLALGRALNRVLSRVLSRAMGTWASAAVALVERLARDRCRWVLRAALSLIVVAWASAEPALAGPPAEPPAEPEHASETGAPVLRIGTWGGAYAAAQAEALFAPFTRATGIEVAVRQYHGGLAELRRQVAGEAEPWDLFDMTMSDTLTACRQGLLRSLPHEALPPSPDGIPAARDFIPDALSRCGVAHTVYATVIAYDRRAFPGIRPTRVADLFDLERFPGRRALQRAPFGNLEWALRAYGVPEADLYNLLSTPRGLRLAFERLGKIADQVRWWRDGERPVTLLSRGEVVMASGYNGRFFEAIAGAGAPIEILWDGQIQELENWTISVASTQPKVAWEFVRYATSTEALARFARHLPYGPTRDSANARVSTHVDTGIDMQPHLPTHPVNARAPIIKDVEWYARTHDRILAIFERWLAGQPAR